MGAKRAGADEGAAQTAYCNDRVVGGFLLFAVLNHIVDLLHPCLSPSNSLSIYFCMTVLYKR